MLRKAASSTIGLALVALVLILIAIIPVPPGSPADGHEFTRVIGSAICLWGAIALMALAIVRHEQKRSTLGRF